MLPIYVWVVFALVNLVLLVLLRPAFFRDWNDFFTGLAMLLMSLLMRHGAGDAEDGNQAFKMFIFVLMFGGLIYAEFALVINPHVMPIFHSTAGTLQLE